MSEAGAGPRESFGRYLTQQRELRGLSLETVADQTKLSVSLLKALEGDDFERLPERVFVVGAVKAYARAVGLSVEETVLRLEEALLGNDATAQTPLDTRRKKTGLYLGAGAAALALAALAAFALMHH